MEPFIYVLVNRNDVSQNKELDTINAAILRHLLYMPDTTVKGINRGIFYGIANLEMLWLLLFRLSDRGLIAPKPPYLYDKDYFSIEYQLTPSGLTWLSDYELSGEDR